MDARSGEQQLRCSVQRALRLTFMHDLHPILADGLSAQVQLEREPLACLSKEGITHHDH
jgi:hypothetical protein